MKHEGRNIEHYPCLASCLMFYASVHNFITGINILF